MAEHQTTSEDIAQAESNMTPTMRAQSAGRWEIVKHTQDLLNAGVDENTIGKVINASTGRIEQEYKELAAADPLLRLASILNESAQTEGDRLIAGETIKKFEPFRRTAAQALAPENGFEKQAQEPKNFSTRLNDVLSNGTITFDTVCRGGDLHAVGEIIPEIFVSQIEYVENKPYPLTAAYCEKILHLLGVYDEQGKPTVDVQSLGSGCIHIDSTTTNIPGVGVNYYPKLEPPVLAFAFEAPAVEKIIALPTQ